jgi:predicted CopG family antitoxin
MPNKTVRINRETYAKLQALAIETGDTLPELLERIIEAYRRKQFLAECNRAYHVLKSDRKAWAEELQEREIWECTLPDGLDNEES